MEGLSTFLSVLAIMIALGALWMLAEAGKKIEEQNQKFFDTHIRSLKATVTEQAKTLDALSRSVGGLESDLQALRERGQRAESQMAAVESGLRALTEALKNLDQSIPQRYRLRVAKNGNDSHSVQ